MCCVVPSLICPPVLTYKQINGHSCERLVPETLCAFLQFLELLWGVTAAKQNGRAHAIASIVPAVLNFVPPNCHPVCWLTGCLAGLSG